MSRANRFPILATIAGVFLLTACEDGSEFPFLQGNPDFVTGTEASGETGSAEPSFKVVEQEVEAPDVFAANEAALWDGRPSLGGVWVAHPDVAEPEQVRIRNEANGTTINGALFRRERDIPGPRTQVSSDAAAALGMLAGQPTVLDIVAIRREEVQVPIASPPPETVDLGEATGEEIEATTLDAPDEQAAAPSTAAAVAVAQVEEEPVAPGQETEDPIAVAEAAILAVGAASASEAAAATETASDSADATVVAAATTESAPSRLRRPYIQIGIFGVEENAKAAEDSLRAAGVIPTIRQEDSGGKSVWRVLAGPSGKISERRALLVKVRELGYEDAYFVRN